MNLNVNKIKLVLAEKGMLLQELAAQSGISRQSVSAVMARGTCSIVTAGILNLNIYSGSRELSI